MQALEVKNFLEAKLPGAVVEVEGEGCNFQLNLISDELAALSPVKRQQQIYAHLNACIADGSQWRHPRRDHEILQPGLLGRAFLSPRPEWTN